MISWGRSAVSPSLEILSPEDCWFFSVIDVAESSCPVVIVAALQAATIPTSAEAFKSRLPRYAEFFILDSSQVFPSLDLGWISIICTLVPPMIAFKPMLITNQSADGWIRGHGQ